MPPGSDSQYLVGRIDGKDAGAVASVPEGAPTAEEWQAVWNTYIWVESADDTAAKAIELGGRVISEPLDVQQFGRMAVLADPEGSVFCVWQAGEHRGAEVVNEHGSVNFNDLNTRDVDAARAFYGELFGWEILDLGGGYMWTLSDYGARLDLLNPGTTERIKDAGGPEGFEQVVASLTEIPADRPDTPAHWGVVFAVDDAKETAARAQELGGEVLIEPYDMPWVRQTVLRDPQGAVFVASHTFRRTPDPDNSRAARLGVVADITGE
jgi:predicted enzyme related to lactoylglutathione lyase